MGEIYNDDFPVLSYVGFQTIMGHHKNDAYDPIACLHASRDMDAPLHHYHISCSDGSAEDIATKERGDSSLLEPEHRPNCYAAAVRQGVRALELRCFEERVNSASSITDLYVGSSKDRQRVNFKGTTSLPDLCMNLILSSYPRDSHRNQRCRFHDGLDPSDSHARNRMLSRTAEAGL